MRPYRQLEGISQSMLKKLAYRPADYLVIEDDSEGYHFKLGTMIDKLVKSEADFDNSYSVITITPSDAIKNIIEIYLSERKDDLELSDETHLMQIGRRVDYSSHIKKPETYLNKLKNTETLAYAKEFVNNRDKLIISKDEWDRVKHLVSLMKENPFTAYYADRQETDTIKVYDDLVIQFEVEGRLCKCEIDRLILNLDTSVAEPVDFKSTSRSSLEGFNYSFFSYGYHVQAWWYTTAIKAFLATKYPDFEWVLRPFAFTVVETTKDNARAFMAEASSEVVEAGWTGFTTKTGRFIEGAKQLLERLDFHEVYGFGEFPMEYMKQGCLDIKLI